MRRPKRKLCYAMKDKEKECQFKEWAGKVSLGGVDRMFDDLEASSNDEDDNLLSTPLQRDMIKELPRHKVSPEKGVSPELRPLSPDLDIGLNCPFKGDGPVKTSSPIEKESVVTVNNRNEGAMSPIIFPCDNNGTEESNMDNRCNETDFESPPRRVTFNRCKMSEEKDTAQISRKKSPRSTASTARRKPEATTTVEKSQSAPEQPFVEMPSRAEKDMTSFLQKLRDAAQPKPPRKSLTPVKVITPPVPEDDFLILEDEGPFWISIPCKATTSKKHTGMSSKDKDSSVDKGAKGSSPRSAPKQSHTDQASDEPEPETISRKVRKKGSEKNQAAVHGNKVDGTLSPEEPPSAGVKEPQKPSKRKHPREVPSEDGDNAEEQPQNTVRQASGGRGKAPAKKENRKKNSNDMKTVKDRSRKVPQNVVLDDATVAQSQGEDCVGHAGVDETDTDKQSKIAAVSEEGSSGDNPVITKRKRRPPGEWWVSSSLGQNEDVTDSPPTPKKSKQNKNKPKTALISPANAKDGAAKKRNQEQPAQSPIQKTQTLKKGNKEKKDKQNNNLNLKGCAPGRRKLFHDAEAEQIEHQEVMDQEAIPLYCIPLEFPETSCTLNSKKQSSRPAAASSKTSQEQPAPEEPKKRRRQPPGDWWMVNGSSEDVESDSWRPQNQEVKRRSGRKKQLKPKPKTPQNNNMSFSPVPAEGTPAPTLAAKPLSAPKSVKRSLATFQEIFTSAAETPAVRGHTGAALNNKRMVTSRHAAEITVTECAAGGEGHAAPATNTQQPPESSSNQSDMLLTSLRSGPSSVIEYEDNDDMNLPSRVEALLSTSDLCGPPLTAQYLLPKDKAKLTQWFKTLWSVSPDRGPEVTPDHFDWYFYKGRAMGIQEDVACGSFCSGKLLLGSFMKKPLWVDHSANTVFNLLTSSVKVSINGRESCITPAQAFVVQSGEVYSIHNIMAQPAVLYFTRMYAESPD